MLFGERNVNVKTTKNKCKKRYKRFKLIARMAVPAECGERLLLQFTKKREDKYWYREWISPKKMKRLLKESRRQKNKEFKKQLRLVKKRKERAIEKKKKLARHGKKKIKCGQIECTRKIWVPKYVKAVIACSRCTLKIRQGKKKDTFPEHSINKYLRLQKKWKQRVTKRKQKRKDETPKRYRKIKIKLKKGKKYGKRKIRIRKN